MISFVNYPIITCIQNDAPIATVISDQLAQRLASTHSDLPLLIGIIRTPHGPEFAFSAQKLPVYATACEFFIHDKDRTFKYLTTYVKDKPDPEKKRLLHCFELNNSAARVNHLIESLKKNDKTSVDFWFPFCDKEPVNAQNQAAFIKLADLIADRDSNKALSILQKIQSVNKNFADVYCSQADILYKQKKDPTRAEWLYRRALCIDKTNPRAHYSLGMLLYHSATENTALTTLGINHIKQASKLKEAKTFLQQIAPNVTPIEPPIAADTLSTKLRSKRRAVLAKQPPKFVETTHLPPETVLINLRKATVNKGDDMDK